jgi:hypothetical protein
MKPRACPAGVLIGRGNDTLDPPVAQNRGLRCDTPNDDRVYRVRTRNCPIMPYNRRGYRSHDCPYGLARRRRRADSRCCAAPPVRLSLFGLFFAAPRTWGRCFGLQGPEFAPSEPLFSLLVTVCLAGCLRRVRSLATCRGIMKVLCRARYADAGCVPGWRRTACAAPPPRPVGTSRTLSDAPPSHRS